MPEENIIDISDIDIYVLIQKLWENMKPASFYDSFTKK